MARTISTMGNPVTTLATTSAGKCAPTFTREIHTHPMKTMPSIRGTCRSTVQSAAITVTANDA